MSDTRHYVQYLKEKFLNWKRPPVELPAESIIEEVVDYIVNDVVKQFEELFKLHDKCIYDQEKRHREEIKKLKGTGV